jgi:predicted ATPase
MSKTIIWLSENSLVLKSLNLDFYFPEANYHPKEIIKIIPCLLGKSFCTHSEVIINYLGFMIDQGKVDPTTIELNIIEKDWQTDEWVTKKSTYNKEGYLVNWQLGFFDFERV